MLVDITHWYNIFNQISHSATYWAINRVLIGTQEPLYPEFFISSCRTIPSLCCLWALPLPLYGIPTSMTLALVFIKFFFILIISLMMFLWNIPTLVVLQTDSSSPLMAWPRIASKTLPNLPENIDTYILKHYWKLYIWLDKKNYFSKMDGIFFCKCSPTD